MLRWLIDRQLTAFEADTDYDATYLHQVLRAAGPAAMVRFTLAAQLGNFSGDLPRDAQHAAKLAAIVHEDCGPCTQLAVLFAARAGVPDDLVRAALADDRAGLSDDARLASTFTRAVLGRTDDADDLRAQVIARFGERGLVALAFIMTEAHLYPTVKYAMGHGQSCSLVRVGDTMAPVAHSA